MRTTHTYAKLAVSMSTYEEIYKLLEEAGYQHCFIQDSNDEPVIDMQGIGLVIKEETNV
jgi:hypothetical protein